MLHLIHPATVHFSIAFIVVGGVCELVALAVDDPRAKALGRWGSPALLIGLVALVPTIVSGYVAANTVDVTGDAVALLELHERNGLLLLGLLVLSQFVKAWHRGRPEGWSRLLYGTLVVLSLAAVLYSSWLGGRMVYLEGVGVL